MRRGSLWAGISPRCALGQHPSLNPFSRLPGSRPRWPIPDGGLGFRPVTPELFTTPDARFLTMIMSSNSGGTDRKSTASPPNLKTDSLRLILGAAPNPMVVVNGDGIMILANKAAQELFGYEMEEMVGQSVELLVPQGARRLHDQLRSRYMDSPQARPMGARRDLWAVGQDGRAIFVEIGLSPVHTADGLLVVCTLVDIGARKRVEERLATVAKQLEGENDKLREEVETDSLTSLKSRQAFLDHLKGQLEMAVRHARPLSVLILDIDHFKQYNDDYGHLAGDEVLEEVGRILKGVARRSDFVGRIGGEEMGIVLAETDREGAAVLGERFRSAIEASPWPRRSVTASIGAATVGFSKAVPRPEAPDLSTILKEADRALYRSKALGRNRVTHAAELASED
jgi:diguanylate cyclase (GGDEF)-like protein/PAS domain S-box-containing protein